MNNFLSTLGNNRYLDFSTMPAATSSAAASSSSSVSNIGASALASLAGAAVSSAVNFPTTFIGSCIFVDETNGIATCEGVSLTADSPDKSLLIKVSGIALKFPGQKIENLKKTKPVLFSGSLHLTCSMRGDVMKIVEIFKEFEDETCLGKQTYYVMDTSKVKSSVAFNIYNYLPQNPISEDVRKKCSKIKLSHPNFVPEKTLYNQHGIVLWGKDSVSNADCLFWASPQDNELKLITDFTATRQTYNLVPELSNIGWIMTITSHDLFLNVEYSDGVVISPFTTLNGSSGVECPR